MGSSVYNPRKLYKLLLNKYSKTDLKNEFECSFVTLNKKLTSYDHLTIRDLKTISYLLQIPLHEVIIIVLSNTVHSNNIRSNWFDE